MLHKRFLNDNVNEYESFLTKNETAAMEIKRLRVLATEIIKTLNNMNPDYTRDIFIPKSSAKFRPHDIIASYYITAIYSDRSLKHLVLNFGINYHLT